MTATLLLPAAGLATRISGLPKFALPVGSEATPLIRRHVEAANRWGIHALVGTRREWSSLMTVLLRGTESEVHFLETRTGSETIQQLAHECPARNDLLVSLPDTWISTLEEDLGELASSLASPAPHGRAPQAVAVTYATDPLHQGKLGTCVIERGYVTEIHDKKFVAGATRHWGLLGARKETWIDQLRPTTPHAGYLIDAVLSQGGNVASLDSEGSYVDCGTIQGYFGALKETLLGE